MTRTRLIVLAAMMLPALAACGPTAEQRCAGAKDPVTCTAVVGSNSGSTDALLAGVAGVAIGSTLAGRSSPTTIVTAPVAPIDAARFHDRAQRSRTITTTTSRGLFGTRTVTRTTTGASRPSYSSSSRPRR